jgi:hypothetical protein
MLYNNAAGQIWDRGTGKAGEWEALTQGTQGEKT